MVTHSPKTPPSLVLHNIPVEAIFTLCLLILRLISIRALLKSALLIKEADEMGPMGVFHTCRRK